MFKVVLPFLALITVTCAAAAGQTQTDTVASAIHRALPLPSQTPGGHYRTETKYTDGGIAGQYGYQSDNHAVQVAYATPGQTGSTGTTGTVNAVDTTGLGVSGQVGTVYVPSTYSTYYPTAQQQTGYTYQAQVPAQPVLPVQQQQTYSYGQPSTTYYAGQPSTAYYAGQPSTAYYAYPQGYSQFRPTGQYTPTATTYLSRVQQGSYGQPLFYTTRTGQAGGSQFYFGQAVPAGTQTADGISQAILQPSLYSHLGRYSNVHQTPLTAVQQTGQWYPGLSSYAHIKPSA